MDEQSPSVALIFALVCALLTSCSTTALGTQRRLGHEVFEEELSKHKLVTPTALKFLRRRALLVHTDAVSPGIYVPSSVFDGALTSCNYDRELSRLAQALNNGQNIASFDLKTKSDPLAGIPEEPSPLQRIQQQRDALPYTGNIPARTNPFVDRNRCDLSVCINRNTNPFQACDPTTSGNTFYAEEILDLKFIVRVEPTIESQCCRLLINSLDATQPINHNLTSLSAEAEKNIEELELSAVAYSDDEVWDLLDLFLISNPNIRNDTQLAMPQIMFDKISDQFVSLLPSINTLFPNKIHPTARLTFDQSDVRDASRTDFKLWFEARTDGKIIYVSPFLARAPFFLCFNKGPRDYVSFQYRLRKKLMSDGWSSMSEGDTRSQARYLAKLDAEYTQCIEKQLAFTFAHEFGHIVGRVDSNNGTVSESQADCIAYLYTKQKGPVDISVLRRLVLKEHTPPMEVRLNKIDKLIVDLESISPPVEGAEIVNFCYSRSRPKGSGGS